MIDKASPSAMTTPPLTPHELAATRRAVAADNPTPPPVNLEPTPEEAETLRFHGWRFREYGKSYRCRSCGNFVDTNEWISPRGSSYHARCVLKSAQARKALHLPRLTTDTAPLPPAPTLPRCDRCGEALPLIWMAIYPAGQFCPECDRTRAADSEAPR